MHLEAKTTVSVPASTGEMPLLVGLIGHPVAGNPTGPMLEATFAHHGLDWRYVSMDVLPERLAPAVAGLAALGFRGFHVTVPHKVAIVEHMERLTEAAALIGAVNCVIAEGDGWLGENTDGKGFLESLEAVVDPKGLRVCLLGAGGAARAVAVELALAGARSIEIVNRDATRARVLADLIADRTAASSSVRSWSAPIEIGAAVDLVVNATSLGLNDPNTGPELDFSRAAGPLVADVVVHPPLTRLLREAGAAGLRTLDGQGMLVNQGARGFRLWTGIEPDRAVMRAALATR
jgi:shikimate dehydrogenase